MSTNKEMHFNFKSFLTVIWDNKFTIFFITSFFIIISILYSIYLPNEYRSEAIVKLSQQHASGTSSLAAQYGGIAAAAGIDIPGSSSEKSEDLVIEIIKSREFLKHLLTFENVLPQIMAAKKFDFETQKTIFDRKLYLSKNNKWVRKPKSPFGVIPSYLEAHELYINELLTVYFDKKTNFITINITHVSPIFAENFLTLIINEINRLEREKDLFTINKKLIYLEDQLSKYEIKDIQDSIFNIMEIQLEKKMLTDINDEYFIEILDSPFMPEEKSSPQRSLICILGAVLGFIFSVSFVLLRNINDIKLETSS
jgi:uncharacterized protein involved in exopolysaccharide biosynthesis